MYALGHVCSFLCVTADLITGIMPPPPHQKVSLTSATEATEENEGNSLLCVCRVLGVVYIVLSECLEVVHLKSHLKHVNIQSV